MIRARKESSAPVPPSVLAVAVAVFTACAFRQLSGLTLVLSLAGGVGGAVGLYSYGLLSRRRSALFWDGQRLLFRGAFGRLRTIVPARVVHVVLYQSHQPQHRLWLDEHGRCQLVLAEAGWDVEELEQLRVRLGIPAESAIAPMDTEDMAKIYPGSVPFCLARPITTAVLAWALVLALYFPARMLLDS